MCWIHQGSDPEPNDSFQCLLFDVVRSAKVMRLLQHMVNHPPNAIPRPALFDAIVQLLQKPLTPSAALTEEDELQAIDNQDEYGYQSNYSRLTTVGAKKKDYAGEVADPKMFLRQSLVALRQSQPGKVMFPPSRSIVNSGLTYALDRIGSFPAQS